jgi:hypothetical protein
MRAQEFIINEDTTASADIAVVVQPLGNIISRSAVPDSGKYKNSLTRDNYKNAVRKS